MKNLFLLYSLILLVPSISSGKNTELDIIIRGVLFKDGLIIRYAVKNLTKSDVWVCEGIQYDEENSVMLTEQKKEKTLTVDVSTKGIPEDVDYFGGLEGKYRKIKPLTTEDFELKIKLSLNPDASLFEKILLRVGYYSVFPAKEYKNISDNVRVFNFYQEGITEGKYIEKETAFLSGVKPTLPPPRPSAAG